jgi:hypothetical protein
MELLYIRRSPLVEKEPRLMYPEKTNAEFVQVLENASQDEGER